jgi:hypothetical protein
MLGERVAAGAGALGLPQVGLEELTGIREQRLDAILRTLRGRYFPRCFDAEMLADRA